MPDGFDSVADALGHRYRRVVLSHLVDQNPLDDDDPALLQRASGAPTADSTDLERVQVGMQHTHLPKLDAAGYADWDRQSGTIVKGPNWEEIAPMLELLEEHEDELPVEWH